VSSADELESRVNRLCERGVTVLDPRQTWVGPAVDPTRIHPGATLYPGTQLRGANVYVGAGAVVGPQGPAVLVDTVVGRNAVVSSGYFHGAVLFRGAVAGPNAHFRPGTILEEEASTGHAVGLKQSILMSFVTLGSCINFCDVLMAGGTSRRDHSEVGSGFIHFNYTPWGVRGDTATPSMMGDVPAGVFLRERRIFLGGVGGMVGPRSVGFGSVAAAGQVLRRDVPADHLVSETPPRLRRRLDDRRLDGVEPRARRNVRFIANLVALRAWYQHVRRPRVLDTDDGTAVVDAGLAGIAGAIAERCKRLAAFLEERNRAMPVLDLDTHLACPLTVEVGSDAELDHVQWVQSLPPAELDVGRQWLESIVARVVDSAP